MTQHLFDERKPGDAISAKIFNEIQDVCEELDHALDIVTDNQTIIEWVRMTSALGPGAYSGVAANVQWLNRVSSQWEDVTPIRSVTITDPSQTLYFKVGAIVPVLAHWSGLYVPIAGGNGTVLRGTLGQTLLNSNTTSITISGITGVTSADNPMGYAGPNGAKVNVTNVAGNWEITGVQQYVQTRVSNSLVDSSSLTTKIQQTKQDFVGMDAANSTTTDVIALVDQVIVDNVPIDAPNRKLQQTKKTIKIFPTTNPDATTDVDDGLSC